MIGAGTFINPVIKVLTVAGILAAIYFFMVGPILDTTEDTIDKSFEQSRELSQGISNSVNQSVRKSQRQAQKAPRNAGAQTQTTVSIEDAQKVLNCIQRAAGDVDRMAACNQP